MSAIAEMISEYKNRIWELNSALSEALARAEKAERGEQLAQQRFESQCALWKPVDDYARQHPEMLLGHSVPEHALRLMQERDVEIMGHDATKAALAKVQADLQAALDREKVAREQEPVATIHGDGWWTRPSIKGDPVKGWHAFSKLDVYAAPIPAPQAQLPQELLNDIRKIAREMQDEGNRVSMGFRSPSVLTLLATKLVTLLSDVDRALLQQSEVKS